MKANQDAYGRLLMDFYCNGGGQHVIERIDGYIEPMSSCKEYFAISEEWDDATKTALCLAKGRVLDIGAGAGRYAICMQEKGFEVTGIDNSPLAVELCRKRGLKDARVISMKQISKKLGKFDTIIMMGNNFGLFESLEGVKSGLKRLYEITGENGIIIAQSRNIYETRMPEHLEYHEYNRKRGRMAGQIRLRIRFKKYATPWEDYLMVSKEEMEQSIVGTGWKIDRFIDGTSAMYYAVLVKA